MTQLLDKAFKEASKLPVVDQKALTNELPHVCHSRLSGILLRSDSGQARMTEDDLAMWFYL